MKYGFPRSQERICCGLRCLGPAHQRLDAVGDLLGWLAELGDGPVGRVAFGDVITREAVEQALEEFRRNVPYRMRNEYGGGFSTHRYIRYEGGHYDQKLIPRAPHEILRRCQLDVAPLATGSRRPRAGQVHKHLGSLGIEVITSESLHKTHRTVGGDAL